MAKITEEFLSNEDLIWRICLIWKNEERQAAEICFLKLRLESNMTPRLRAESVGQRSRFLKKRDELIILKHCCEVPTRRYSVLDGFTDLHRT